MEEAEQKRQNGEIAIDITPEQAAKDAEKVSLHCNWLPALTVHKPVSVSHAVHSLDHKCI